jgi:hypothetical protein
MRQLRHDHYPTPTPEGAGARFRSHAVKEGENRSAGTVYTPYAPRCVLHPPVFHAEEHSCPNSPRQSTRLTRT